YVGKYFLGDYCSGFIRILNPSTAQATEFVTGASQPVDIQVGADGSLYYLARGTSRYESSLYDKLLAGNYHSTDFTTGFSGLSSYVFSRCQWPSSLQLSMAEKWRKYRWRYCLIVQVRDDFSRHRSAISSSSERCLWQCFE